MENVIELLKNIISDRYLFLLFQISVFIIFIFAIIKEIMAKYCNPKRTITRGDESISKLHIAYGISSVLIIQIINISTVYNNHKVFISISNILILFYLCYFNSWSRNKIMNFLSSIKNKKEIV